MPVAGAKSGHERERLLARLDDASLRRPQASLTDSLRQVTKFQGKRLANLSEAVRRCIERVQGTQ